MPNELNLTYPGSATLYALLRRQSDAYAWNGSAFEPWLDANLSSYAIPLASRGGDLYQADFPPVAAARYRLIYFLQSSSAPSTTDLLLATRDLRWTGSAITTSPSTTLDPYALTTLSGVKQFLRLDPTDPTDDDLLTALINQVSARVETICRRKFLARDYLERNPAQSDAPRCLTLLLRQHPVLHITRLSSGQAPALALRFTASAIRATASISQDQDANPAALLLTTVDSAGLPTVTTLSFATYQSIQSLAAAISIITGWEATALVNIPSVDLNPIGSVNTLTSNTTSGGTLTYPDQDHSHYLLNHRTGGLTLPHHTSQALTFTSSNFSLSPWKARDGYSNPGVSSNPTFLIQYRAGYDTLPPDLQMIVHELVAQDYQLGKQNPTLIRESFPDYSYTRQSLTTLTADQSTRLQPYIELR